MGRWLLLSLGLWACAGDPAGPSNGSELTPSVNAPGTSSDAADNDGDGLCDDTEAELETDPLSDDTDGDGLPDLIEAVSSFAPVDPDSPARDQIAFLEGSRGRTLDFAVRSTVVGDGQSLAGWFSPAGSFYGDELTSGDFFKGATAVSADPVDAARSINEGSAQFAAVLGRTRLAFNLRFEFGDRADFECGRAYPFRYAIKSEDGTTQGERFYLLVVGAGGSTLDAANYCVPSPCE